MASNDAGSIADQLAAEVRKLLQRADEQAKQVMDKAEAEVARIRAEAEKEGHRRIADARSALDDIEGRLGTGPAPDAGTPSVPDPVPESEPEVEEEPQAVEDDAVSDPVPESGPAPAPAPASARSGDESAARLVAMKMALDGSSRDEVRGKLEADYSVADMDGLLDDVFAKAGR